MYSVEGSCDVWFMRVCLLGLAYATAVCTVLREAVMCGLQLFVCL